MWFWAAYLVATHTPGISAVQLQRQLGISRYETVWLILQKLRRAMVAPEREPLRAEVEIDETLVGGRHEGRRGGRQRDGKALVGVEVRGAGSGRLRLRVLPDASQETLTPWVKEIVAPGAIVHTDDRAPGAMSGATAGRRPGPGAPGDASTAPLSRSERRTRAAKRRPGCRPDRPSSRSSCRRSP
jgi:hypothetical protein